MGVGGKGFQPFSPPEKIGLFDPVGIVGSAKILIFKEAIIVFGKSNSTDCAHNGFNLMPDP